MTARRAIVAGAVLWACVSAAGAAVVADSEPQALDVPTGQPASVLAGAPLTHVVMFATWCETCVDEIPLLADLAARWEDDGYRIVFVAVQARQTRERLLRFDEHNRLPGRLLMDVIGAVRQMLEVDVVPTHVLLDSRGREIHRATVLDDGIRNAIAIQLGGRQ